MREWPETGRGVILPSVCDHWGHMNVRYYLHHFDDSTFHVWAVHGVTIEDILSHGVHTVIARDTMNFRQEIKAGALWVIRSVFTRVGRRSVTQMHRMYNAETGALHADMECVEVFFDPESRASAPIPETIKAKLAPQVVEIED